MGERFKATLGHTGASGWAYHGRTRIRYKMREKRRTTFLRIVLFTYSVTNLARHYGNIYSVKPQYRRITLPSRRLAKIFFKSIRGGQKVDFQSSRFKYCSRFGPKYWFPDPRSLKKSIRREGNVSLRYVSICFCAGEK
jgi:hypothetical protein